jgi:hypothetical protein
MSTADFQARLQRINANAPQQQPMVHGRLQANRAGAKKTNFGQLAVGAIAMSLGVQILKYPIKNYDAIRDGSGIGTAAGYGLAGTVVLLLSIFLIVRAVPNRSKNSRYAANVELPVRQASNRAKLICSLLGFALGAIAFLYLYMAAASTGIETEKARIFAYGGLLIAAFLSTVAILIGMAGPFLRGYALGRVPVYFVIAAGLSFAAVRLFRVNILEWQQFTVLLQ